MESPSAGCHEPDEYRQRDFQDCISYADVPVGLLQYELHLATEDLLGIFISVFFSFSPSAFW